MPACLCKTAMVFLVNNRKYTLWECPNCGRLLLRPTNADWQRWYIPEIRLKKFEWVDEPVPEKEGGGSEHGG